MEKEGGFIGSFDLIIPFTKESLVEAYRYSTYSSVLIEDWTVDEPIKNENDIKQTLESYRQTRDVIFDKINKLFTCLFEYFSYLPE